MKDKKKEIEMALLDQLCSLIDKSAMEEYKPKMSAMVISKDSEEEEEEMMEESSEEMPDEDDMMTKLRKLAKQKAMQE